MKKKIKKNFPYTISYIIKNALDHISNDLNLNSIVKSTILLSPAAASFDQFSNFEHRGNYFRQQVAKKFKREFNV